MLSTFTQKQLRKPVICTNTGVWCFIPLPLKTRASNSAWESSFYLYSHPTSQNKLLYQYLFLLLNCGYSPSIPSLLILVLGSPYRPAWQTFLPLLRGAEPKIVPCWHSSHDWVATFQSHFVPGHQKARHAHTHTHTLKGCPCITTVSSIRKHGFLPPDRHRN